MSITVAARTVGILAGSGSLPGMLIEACRAGGREPFVIAFNGFTDPETVGNVRHEWVDIAAVGKTFRTSREAACESVVMAGKLPILHGHEINHIDRAVNPARGLFLKAKSWAACSHCHSTS